MGYLDLIFQTNVLPKVQMEVGKSFTSLPHFSSKSLTVPIERRLGGEMISAGATIRQTRWPPRAHGKGGHKNEQRAVQNS